MRHKYKALGMSVVGFLVLVSFQNCSKYNGNIKVTEALDSKLSGYGGSVDVVIAEGQEPIKVDVVPSADSVIVNDDIKKDDGSHQQTRVDVVSDVSREDKEQSEVESDPAVSVAEKDGQKENELEVLPAPHIEVEAEKTPHTDVVQEPETEVEQHNDSVDSILAACGVDKSDLAGAVNLDPNATSLVGNGIIIIGVDAELIDLEKVTGSVTLISLNSERPVINVIRHLTGKAKVCNIDIGRIEGKGKCGFGNARILGGSVIHLPSGVSIGEDGRLSCGK